MIGYRVMLFVRITMIPGTSVRFRGQLGCVCVGRRTRRCRRSSAYHSDRCSKRSETMMTVLRQVMIPHRDALQVKKRLLRVRARLIMQRLRVIGVPIYPSVLKLGPSVLSIRNRLRVNNVDVTRHVGSISLVLQTRYLSRRHSILLRRIHEGGFQGNVRPIFTGALRGK